MDSGLERTYYWPPWDQTVGASYSHATYHSIGPSSSYVAYHSYALNDMYITLALSSSYLTLLAYLLLEFTLIASMGIMDKLQFETFYSLHGVNSVLRNRAMRPKPRHWPEWRFFVYSWPWGWCVDMRRNPHRSVRDN